MGRENRRRADPSGPRRRRSPREHAPSRSARPPGRPVVVAATACWPAVATLNPGVAVKAGDETISVREVDDTRRGLLHGAQAPARGAATRCPSATSAAASPASWPSGRWPSSSPTSTTSSPASPVRRPGRRDRAGRAASSTRTSRTAVITIDTAGAYIEGVQAAVGDLLLTRGGHAGAQYSDQVARGQQAYERVDRRARRRVRPAVRRRPGQGPDRAGRHLRLVRRRRHRQGRRGRAARPGVRRARCPARTPAAADRPAMGEPAPGERLLEFLEVMRRLRAECAWKAGQTHRSLARYLLEETHETLEAIDTGDLEHLREELGDLLLQVYFHAVIAEESGAFTIDDVAGDIIEKMHRRNPHVFAPAGGRADAGRRCRDHQRGLGVDQGAGEAPRLGRSRDCRPACRRCCTPTRCSTGWSATAHPVEPPSNPAATTSATGCWPWSPRRATPASTRSRRCATPYAAACDARRTRT